MWLLGTASRCGWARDDGLEGAGGFRRVRTSIKPRERLTASCSLARPSPRERAYPDGLFEAVGLGTILLSDVVQWATLFFLQAHALFDFCCSPLLHSAQPGHLTALPTQTYKGAPSGAARHGRPLSLLAMGELRSVATRTVELLEVAGSFHLQAILGFVRGKRRFDGEVCRGGRIGEKFGATDCGFRAFRFFFLQTPA